MIDDFNRGRVFAMYSEQKTKNFSEIGRVIGISRSVVADIVRNGFKKREYHRRPSRKMLIRQKELVALAKKTCRKQSRVWPKYGSATQLRAALKSKTGELLSVRQITRCLHAAGLKTYVRPAVPTRKAEDLCNKRAFAKRMRSLPPRQLKNIVFSDESWLCCAERTGKRQWCASRQEVLSIEKKCRWNVPSIMIWSSVGIGFKGPLVIFPSKVSSEGELKVFRLNSDQYIRRCLSVLVPKLAGSGRILQQDGARSHACKATLAYLTRKNVPYLADWPPYCPDLNAIERVWKEVKQRVGERCPLTQDELIAAAHAVWAELPQDLIDRHCAHFGKQVQIL